MVDVKSTRPGAEAEGRCSGRMLCEATIEPERRGAGCGGSELKYERLTPQSFAIPSKMFEWLSQYSNVTSRLVCTLGPVQLQ